MTIEQLEFACGIRESLEGAPEEENLQCWIECANWKTSEFPIQNLPFGVFSRPEDSLKTIGVAIGDQILDLRRCVQAKLICGMEPKIQLALTRESLNEFFSLGKEAWSKTRKEILTLMKSGSAVLRDNERLKKVILFPLNEAIMHLPFKVGDYTDFYTSLCHAENIGKKFRPDNPLFPNFKNMPIGYNGRASSIVLSGTPIPRPKGQVLPKGAEKPLLLPTAMLDYEMELGAVIGTENPLGQPVPVDRAASHIFGMAILNDWSARDVQKWEYRPLGPFNGKNFATTISPWVVTMEALEPYRVPGPPRSEGDPEMLDYLKASEDWAYDITVEVSLSSEKMREEGMEPMVLSRANFRQMYWTWPQMVAHHTSTGTNLRPGDLLGSGTISGDGGGTVGCLLEMGEIELPDGSRRRFLEDGDEVVMKAYAQKEGLPRIGFGECRGVVVKGGE